MTEDKKREPVRDTLIETNTERTTEELMEESEHYFGVLNQKLDALAEEIDDELSKGPQGRGLILECNRCCPTIGVYVAAERDMEYREIYIEIMLGFFTVAVGVRV